MLRFSIRIIYQNATFVFPSTEQIEQRDVSTCIRSQVYFRSQSILRSPFSEFFRRDAELTACHCRPGAEFGWRPQLATFASDRMVDGEKRRQRDFIKKHTGIKVRDERGRARERERAERGIQCKSDPRRR